MPIHGQRSQLTFNVPWGLLSAAGVGLLAIWLTVAHGLPFGHDSIRHIYRLVERDYLIRHGLFFTRWSPFFGYGYGYPLYNFDQPLLRYLAEPFMLLGAGPLVALRITLSLALIGGALGVYCYVDELFGAGAGVVAATAYIFSPYLMYTLVSRAGFPEIVALALLPWGLWTAHRYTNDGRLKYGLTIAVCVAAVMLAHLFTAYLFIAHLFVYLLALRLMSTGYKWKLTDLLSMYWPIALGMGIAAFFWLPAMQETNLIYIERMLEISNPATGQGLMPVREIFAGSILPDLNAPIATITPRISWFMAVLALIGVITGLIALSSTPLRVNLLVGFILAAMSVFMLTPTARWLWQTVPMLRLGQFPFRFLGVAALWLAMLAGAGTAALLALLNQSAAWHQLATVTVVGSLCLIFTLYSLNWPTITYHSPIMPVDLTTAMQIERKTEQMGLMPRNEYSPKSIKQMPLPETGPGVNEARLDIHSLPAGTRQIAATYNLLNYSITLDAPRPFQAVIKTFYFPGWWATRDGHKVPISPTEPYGFISLPIGAGRQQIEIGFGTTPIRTVADGITLFSIICLVGLSIKTTKFLTMVNE